VVRPFFGRLPSPTTRYVRGERISPARLSILGSQPAVTSQVMTGVRGLWSEIIETYARGHLDRVRLRIPGSGPTRALRLASRSERAMVCRRAGETGRFPDGRDLGRPPGCRTVYGGMAECRADAPDVSIYGTPRDGPARRTRSELVDGRTRFVPTVDGRRCLLARRGS